MICRDEDVEVAVPVIVRVGRPAGDERTRERLADTAARVVELPCPTLRNRSGGCLNCTFG